MYRPCHAYFHAGHDPNVVTPLAGVRGGNMYSPCHAYFRAGHDPNVVTPLAGVRGGNIYSPRHAYFRAGYETKMVLVSLKSSTAFFPSSRWPLPLAFMPPKGMCISAPVVGALM